MQILFSCNWRHQSKVSTLECKGTEMNTRETTQTDLFTKDFALDWISWKADPQIIYQLNVTFMQGNGKRPNID